MVFKLQAPALTLPFRHAAEVIQNGSGIQKHKEDKTVPEERAVSDCFNVCEFPSTTQVGSTELMEHLKVMVSQFQGYHRQMKVLCAGEVDRSGVGERQTSYSLKGI